jgi:GH15 family glucan-1,4-alpha-glucosidase
MRAPFEVPTKERYKPIGGYGIIGNTRTAALVGFDGSIDWCCMPRFDSPSVFAALLDWKKGGRWVIQPAEAASATQSYLPETNILRTEFKTRGAHVTLTDFMPCSVANDEWTTPPEIHRLVQCPKGEMELRFVFDPVFDYGARVPRTTATRDGLSVKDAKDEMVLSWSVPFGLGKRGVDGSFSVSEGEARTFVLSYGEAIPRRVAEYHTERQRAKTEVFWMDWVSQLRYRGRWREMVMRSALTLKLLVYARTGAIIAAPTTSLPEEIGGSKNWDYRYSWIRDSASSLWTFHLLGYRSETEAYLQWLIDNNPALDLDLRLMYDLLGGTNIPETVLGQLEGYRGSRPVRVGNAAAKQHQLDAYGYMLDSLYFTTRHGLSVRDEMYFRFVKPLANYIVEHWKEPGNGIWERRGRREHYVYTKAWCWAGLDRAVKIAKATGHPEDVDGWNAVRKRIRAEVMRRGWSEEKGSFVMRYGSKSLDAANLMLPLIGFVRADDERMVMTIEATMKELSAGAFVYRHRAEGARSEEGAFLLCSFWLVACLAKIGRVDEAMDNLTQLIGRSNHLGLFAEEVDPKTGDALGNFPQAFSHIGLILAAHALDRALDSKDGPA